MSFKTFIITWAILFTLAMWIPIILAFQAKADDVIELDKVAIDYMFFRDGSIDPMITYDGMGKSLSRGLNLHLDTTVFTYFYSNFNVLSVTDQDPQGWGQFRTVGLEMKIGARVTEWLDLGYYHFSRHLLDTPQPNNQAFLQEDALVLTLKLYDARKQHSPLW